MYKAHEEMYRGYQINVYQDENAESPDTWKDDVLFLVGYHRNFTVDRGERQMITIFREEEFKNGDKRAYADGYGWKSLDEAKAQNLINKQVRRGKYVPGISQELAVAIAGNDEDYSCEVKEYRDKYHIFGLEAYIHSGVSLSLSHEGNFPDRRWDVSQLGLVFVSKEDWPEADQARTAATGVIEEWNQNLGGEVYGYMIGVADDPDDPDTEYSDEGGCWGYYGDADDGEIIVQAKAEIDSMIEADEKKGIAQMDGMDLIEVY
jgi:hypothetical protein